ncbi:MAG: BLUF domain-containing protein [Myxococcota bacterium]
MTEGRDGVEEDERGGDGMEAAGARAEQETLIQCIYMSAAARPFDSEALTTLLARARARNAEAGLTGMLLYADGSFIQVLEGPEEAVDALYRRIEADPRHVEMTKLIREPIPERCFEDWSMGFLQATRDEIARIPGLNDFLRVTHASVEEQAGRARKLLAGFREGRWRKRLSG